MAYLSFIICDSSFLIRKGLAAIISKIPSTRTIDSIDNEKEAIQQLKNTDADFIILNPALFQQNKMEDAFKRICKTRTIALVRNPDQDFNPSHFAETICYEDTQSTILKKLNRLIGQKEAHQNKHKKPEEISSREASIVKYIALGYTNKEIAEKLFISTHTVVTHRKNITRKLGIKTVPGLTIYAILNNIITIDDTEQAKS
ncbi:MAG: response regulator transcription factor [Bacteroidales bacterium]|jgi:DNA-binding NarL/FixJ family response regulator|nr:response regulator transcription factor [Bacteroidales bacterium]